MSKLVRNTAVGALFVLAAAAGPALMATPAQADVGDCFQLLSEQGHSHVEDWVACEIGEVDTPMCEAVLAFHGVDEGLAIEACEAAMLD